jgi:uncharacterized protein (DUF3820 family)
MELHQYGFYLNGKTLIKTITCANLKQAKAKLDFFYPINFNIQIKLIKMNDESIMPFGKYKGEKLANVPAKYLLWLYDQSCNNKELYAYIEENLDALESEVKQ